MAMVFAKIVIILTIFPVTDRNRPAQVRIETELDEMDCVRHPIDITLERIKNVI